jgi:hypothetical protein
MLIGVSSAVVLKGPAVVAAFYDATAVVEPMSSTAAMPLKGLQMIQKLATHGKSVVHIIRFSTYLKLVLVLFGHYIMMHPITTTNYRLPKQ